MAMTLIKVPVGTLKVGDEFIDFTEGGDRYTVGYVDNRSVKVEAYRAHDDYPYEFGIEDEVQIEKYVHGVPA